MKIVKYFIILLIMISILSTLLLTGNYWDDWILYKRSDEFILTLFTNAGNPFQGNLHNLLLSSKNIYFSYRLVQVSFFIINMFLIYKILIQLNKKDKMFFYYIVLIYSIIPLNSAKLALINSLDIIYITIFHLAFFLMTIYLKNKIFLYRLLALCLFSFSFKLNSLFVYYLIFPCFILYKVYFNITTIRTFFKECLKYIDFLLLPIILWIIRLIYFSPTGGYSNYHVMKMSKIIAAFGKTFDGIFLILKQLILKIIDLPFLIIILVIIISFLSMYVCKNKNIITLEFKKSVIYLTLSFVLIYLSLFPYYAVGTTSDFNDWGSRTQGISLLGFSMFISVLIFSISKTKIKLFLGIFSILIFAILNLQNTYNFQLDWYKQLSLIENFKTNKLIKDNTSFLIIDNTKDWNVNNRRIRFYEYSSLFKESFGNEARFALPVDSYRVKYYKKRVLDKFFIKKFKLSEYTYIPSQYYIIIDKKIDLSVLDIIKYKYLEIFEKETFLLYMKNIISIKTKLVENE